MKIVFVGGGNAACVTALHYARWNKYLAEPVEIELRYDAEILPEKVGQASVLSTPALLNETLGWNWYNNTIDATVKSGILYEGWGRKQEKIFHPFPGFAVAFHFSPAKLQQEILASGWFKVVEERVDDLEALDADYVFDCRGKPTSQEILDQYEILPHPVNAAILGKPKEPIVEMMWSKHIATPDGWCFGIPTPIDSPSYPYSYGYIYNKDITSEKEAKTNFVDLFDVEVTGLFPFNCYIAKNPVVDNRKILSGNRLFFLEPLESSAIETYHAWARFTSDAILDGESTLRRAEKSIRKYVSQVRNFVQWHYQNGSKYDTPFWEHAKTFRDFEQDGMFNKFVSFARANRMDYLLALDLELARKITYGQWGRYSFKNWLDGTEIKTRRHSIKNQKLGAQKLDIKKSWDDVYKNSKVSKLPWYTKELDFDVKRELRKKQGSVLDLGTGPGTHAFALSKRGFEVTATDISKTAINNLKKRKTAVIFVNDNILKTKLTEKFDYILDRGTFHTIEPKQRKTYIKNVTKLLKYKGILFLKCWSIKEKKDDGPFKFSKKQIKDYFSKDFRIKSIRDSIFHSTMDSDPKALFVVLEKR